MSKKRTILFKFTNNTTANIAMQILASGNSQDITGQAPRYTYNLTGELFTAATKATLQYRPTAQASLTSIEAPLPARTMAGLIQALNSLGLSTWYTYTVGPAVYVATNSDEYVFGNLTIDSTPPTATIDWANYPANPGGQFDISDDGSLIVASFTGSFDTGSFSAGGGSSIDVSATAPAIGGTQPLDITEDGVSIFSTTVGAGLTVTHNFTAQAGKVYNIVFGVSP